MRTTLDINEVVLSAARARARARGVSVGRALSGIALESLNAPVEPGEKTQFPVLRGVPDHLVTDELVARYRDDD